MRALLRPINVGLAVALAGAWVAVAPACGPYTSSGDPGERALATRASPVFNGVADDKASYSNVVGISIDEERICSGSLISPTLVLTARHCVSKNSLDDVKCGEGALGPSLGAGRLRVTTSVDTTKADTTWLPVSEVWLATGGDDVCGNDIVLLLLSAPVEGVKPLEPYVSQNVGQDQLFTAIGYGGDNIDGGNIGVRRAGFDFQVTCVTGGCNFDDIIRNNEWRGGPPGKYVCRGDSGGPALLGTNYVGGVLSRLLYLDGGEACGTPVYTSTYAWAGFLQTRAVRAALLGHYRLPDWARGGGGLPTEMRFGNTCQSNIDCTSDGTCVFDGDRGYCSYDCDDKTPCPAGGYQCDADVGLCVVQASTPSELSCFGDTNLCAEAQIAQQSKDGCSLGHPPGERGGGQALLIGLLALAGLGVRRVRTM